ncbi:MAG TPA: BatD family protein, partial [candidate division Zixibacteria bacterium]
MFLFSFPAFCQISTLPVKIELKSSVDRSTVPLNQELNFTIQVSWEGEQSRFMITPVAPPQCENLEISGSSSLNESKMEEEKTKSLKTFQFVLKPLQTGTGRIGPVQVNYIDNVTQDSSSLSTQP